MFEALIGIVSGGATGLLGTLVSFGAQYFARRQAHQQEVELRRLDLELAETEGRTAERKAAIEAESQEGTAAWKAMEKSLEGQGERWSRGGSRWLVLVDVIRGLTRPVGAWMFLGIAAAIYFSTSDEEVRTAIVSTVLYLMTAAWLWWFGARVTDKLADRLAGK